MSEKFENKIENFFSPKLLILILTILFFVFSGCSKKEIAEIAEPIGSEIVASAIESSTGETFAKLGNGKYCTQFDQKNNPENIAVCLEKNEMVGSIGVFHSKMKFGSGFWESGDQLKKAGKVDSCTIDGDAYQPEICQKTYNQIIKLMDDEKIKLEKIQQ